MFSCRSDSQQSLRTMHTHAQRTVRRKKGEITVFGEGLEAGGREIIWGQCVVVIVQFRVIRESESEKKCRWCRSGCGGCGTGISLEVID